MGRRVGLWLVLPVLGLVLACSFAATAGAYTYVVRPDVTHQAGAWTITPNIGAAAVLDDPVRPPSLPNTADDHLSHNGNGPVVVEVGLSNVALRPGESVTSVISRGYLQTGDARWLETELRSGGTVLVSDSVWSNVPAAWTSMTYTGALTQAEVNDLRQLATHQGSGASSHTYIYASYAEVVTDGAIPTPTITAGPGVAGQSPNPSWSFSSPLAGSFQCRLEKGATVISDWATCTSAKSYALGGSGDGLYTFRVRGHDDVGTAGTTDASANYTLDRSAPDPPVIDSSPPPDSNNPMAMWAFTGEAGALHSCRLTREGTPDVVVSDWTLCTSPVDYDLAAPAVDGTYTFEVLSTDMAGNAGSPASSSFTLDRGRPVAPTLTAEPPAAGTGTSPSWSFTHEAGTHPKCRLQRGGTLVSDWSPCTSPRSWTLPASPDGLYTFSVRSDDDATNQGFVTSDTYDYDTTSPPTPDITAGPADPSATQTPSYTFTAEGGTTVTQCRMERDGGTVVSNWANCTSPHAPNLTGQPDGEYTLLARSTDAAGNVSSDGTYTYTRDRTAPVLPVITGGPPPSSADAAPSFSFTYENGATANCSITKGATVISPFAPCSSPKGYDLTIPGAGDGAYVFRVRATDDAGNTGPEATRNYTLDRVEPVAPTITGRPAAVTNDTTPTFTFTASFDVVKYRCRLELGSTVISDYTVCSSPQTYNLTTNGTYTFKVRGSDDAANESTETSDTFTLDTNPPPPPVVTGGPTGESQNATPSFTFTKEAGSTTECYVDRGGTMVSDWGPCVSPRSYDFSLLGDGVYTFRVRATDTAGNTGNEGTRFYTLDRTRPAPPVIGGGPAADSNDETPVYSFTAEPGATFTCRLDDGTTPVSDWAPCSTPVGYDLSDPRPDGSYTFRVVATDAAGNPSFEATRTYALDRDPPGAPVLTADPGADTNDGTPTWAFTATAGTTTSCRLERGATVVSGYAPCSGSRTYDVSAQEGTYTFRVLTRDAAGNDSTETAHTTRYDRTLPPAPAITGGPTGPTSNATPSFTFTAETDATTQCLIERDGTVVSGWSACTSPRGYTLTTDGDHVFRVRARDLAGNQGDEATRSFTLDRAAPNPPVITGRPAADTNDETPTWTWTSDPTSTTDRCRVTRDGGTVVVAWTACSSPRSFDLSDPNPDGDYTFHVESRDAALNVSTEETDSFTLDRAKPPAPDITSGPAADSSDDSPTFAFTAETGATTECQVERAGTVVYGFAACTSPYTPDLSDPRPDGTYTFTVRATDAAGNEGPERTRSYTLDRDRPAAPTITAGPTGDSNDDTPTYAWTAESGARTECQIARGGTVVSAFATCTSPHGFDLSSPPNADGPHTFSVQAIDAAGNTSLPATRDYTLDRQPPPEPAITSGPAADSTDDSPTYAFTAESGAALECELRRNGAVVSAFAACASPRTYDVSGDGDGTYTFSVHATDAAGNEGADGTHVYTLDRSTPLMPAIDARPGDDGKDRTPEWAFSTTESARTFECELARGGTVVSAWAPCVSPRQYNLALEPETAYTFSVRARNAAGTRSAPRTDVYRLDTTAPAAPIVSGGPAADSTDATPTWTITAEPGATLECLLERDGTVVSGWTPCSSPQSYNLTTDGAYTFRTRATDAALNTGDEGAASYNLDSTTPTAPVLGASPPAAGSDPTPTWEFTAEPGKTFECRLSRDGTPVTGWEACTSPHTPDLSGADGDYRLEVRAKNAAGTTSEVISDDYKLDRGTPAAPVITDGPPADSPDATPTWTFTGESGATFRCRVERAGTVVAGPAACTSPETSTLTSQPDGTYTFLVHQTDAAGNQSPDASRTYALDRTIPAAPSIDTRPPSPSPDRTPEWTLSGDSALTIECSLTRGGAEVYGWAPCPSPRQYDLAGEPDGTYRLHARQFNPAGTRGPEVSDDYELDAAAPAPPVITGSPGPVANGSSPTWSFTAETGATVECRLERGTVVVHAWATCTSPRTFGLAGEPDGDYTFSVRAVDSAGNTGAAAVDEHRVDRVAPAPPAIGEGPGPLGRARTPSWSFTAEDGAVFECTLRGAVDVVDEWAVCNSPRGYDLGGRGDGAYGFGVRARDAAGNTSVANSAQYVLDTTPGAVSIESGPGALGRDRAPGWRFSGEDGASFECRLSLRDVPVADWGPCVSPRGFDLTGSPDGVFAFSLRATDTAGNVGPTGAATYELDTTPPGAPSIDARPETPGTDRTPTWRFSGDRGATFACRVAREPAGTILDWTLCASPFTADLAREDDGRYRFEVRAADLAGNIGEPAAGAYEVVTPKKDEDRDDEPKGDDKGDTGDVPKEPSGPLTPKPPRVKREREAAPPAAARPKPKRKQERRQTSRPERKAEPSTPPRAQPPAPEEDDGGNFATDAMKDAVKAIAQHPDKSVFPLSLLLLVLAFLAIQNRIDRSDPKLALAPAFADPDLEFRPPPGDEE